MLKIYQIIMEMQVAKTDDDGMRYNDDRLKENKDVIVKNKDIEGKECVSSMEFSHEEKCLTTVKFFPQNNEEPLGENKNIDVIFNVGQPTLKTEKNIQSAYNSKELLPIYDVKRKSSIMFGSEKEFGFIENKEKSFKSSASTSVDIYINPKDMDICVTMLNKVNTKGLISADNNWLEGICKNKNCDDETNIKDLAFRKSVLFDIYPENLIPQLRNNSYFTNEKKQSFDPNKHKCFTEYKSTDRNVPIVEEFCLRNKNLVGLCSEENLNSEKLPSISKVKRKSNYKLKFGKKFFNNVKTQNSSSINKKVYNCYKCAKKYHSSKLLEKHLLTHLLIKPYSCLFCNFKTSYKTSLYSHKFRHPEYKVPLKKFKLKSETDTDILSDKFINETKVAKGDENVTESITSSKCDSLLDTKFKNIFPSDIKTNSDNGFVSFECYLCPFLASTNSELYMHYRKRHYKSKQCRKNLVFLNVVEVTFDHNGTRTFSCPKCSFESTLFRGWMSHYIRLHTGACVKRVKSEVALYCCKFCPFKSSAYGSLLYHNKHHPPIVKLN